MFHLARPVRRRRRWVLPVFVAALAIVSSTSRGQARPGDAAAPAAPDAAATQAATTMAPASPPAATTSAPASQPATGPAVAAYSLSELADRAEATASIIKRVNADLGDDPALDGLDERLRELADEMAARSQETGRLLTAAPSLDTLRSLERDWDGVRRQLAEWSKAVGLRRSTLDRDAAAAEELEAGWRRTLEDVRASGLGESDVAARARGLAAELAALRGRAAARSAELQRLQARLAAQDVRAAEAQANVRDARLVAAGRLLERDSPPVWRGGLGGRGGGEDVAAGSRNSLARQWSATAGYARRAPARFAGHLALVGLLALGARRLGRRWGPVLAQDRATARSARVFRMPIAAALVATMPLIGWFYPDAPRLLMAIVCGALLVPAVAVLSRLVQRPMRPLLYALLVLYALKLLVSVSGSVPALSRGLFLAATAGGAAYLAWFLWRCRGHDRALDRLVGPVRWRVVRLAVRASAALLALAALANAAGFAGLSRLVADALLASAFVGVVFDAYIRVAAALVAVALRVRPLSSLRVVRRNADLLLRRATAVLALAAAAWWALITLDVLSVRRPVLGAAGRALSARWGVGAVDLSLGGLLAFALTVAGAILLSRLVRFLLEEDVYPRVRLARGVPYAISTMLHYAILFLGFLIAVAALGYDMTKFTILAGAFGVGLGFGMQNIVNNFVSGLILLFERPVQVGDVIELDPATVGTVSRIGIRASIVRLSSSAEVIVPNGMLIANRVTNWTLSSRQRGFEVPVSVAAGSNPKAVMALLVQTARDNASVAMEPPPEAYLTDFLPGGGLRFELRVRTERFDDWMRARSELVAAIDAALSARGIQRV
jgi:potassium efflux system protein